MFSLASLIPLNFSKTLICIEPRIPKTEYLVQLQLQEFPHQFLHAEDSILKQNLSRG